MKKLFLLATIIISIVAITSCSEDDPIPMEWEFSAYDQSAVTAVYTPDYVYQVSIRQGLNVVAEKHSMNEVINILLDNARKYCDPNGKVRVELSKSALSKNAVLRVSNTYKEGKNEDYS